MKVLVLDDDPEVLRTSLRALRAYGVEGIGSATCDAAMDVIRAGVDGMVLDVRIGDRICGGLEVLRFVRLEMHSDLPAIMHSGYAEPEDRNEATRLNALYMLKPSPMVGLVEYLRMHQPASSR